jgi:alcohol dehydrogenase class IV
MLFLEYPKKTPSDLLVPFQLERKGKIRFIAIPTTSGSGSEVTCAAVVTSNEKLLKQVVLQEACIPSAALLCPQITIDLPAAVTARSGIDALIHGIESFSSCNATEWTRIYSTEAVRGVLRNLIPAFRNPRTIEHRQVMQKAACFAGIAISNSSAGLSHSLDHVGVIANVSHGDALSSIILTVLQFNIQGNPSVYVDLAEKAGLTENLIETIRKIMVETGLPLTIRDLNISEEKIEKCIPVIVETAEKAFATKNNPRIPTKEEMEKLIWYAYEGRQIDF